ncbi:hypothetical protein [Novosphingobium sp. Rr 2-17]|uniref:hypothetical protein n=1 Tax=Novosphingobium sp. Rr 2-17 TaxID=555793 RepID=UPI001ED94F59|nr:hypothetical protein [Novosphingobium sp. Rr 2-17]
MIGFAERAGHAGDDEGREDEGGGGTRAVLARSRTDRNAEAARVRTRSTNLAKLSVASCAAA